MVESVCGFTKAPLGFPGELFLFAGEGMDCRLVGDEQTKEV